eukprot:767441-Hanusia_phi.AAC.2
MPQQTNEGEAPYYIVAVTAHASKMHVSECLEAGGTLLPALLLLLPLPASLHPPHLPPSMLSLSLFLLSLRSSFLPQLSRTPSRTLTVPSLRLSFSICRPSLSLSSHFLSPLLSPYLLCCLPISSAVSLSPLLHESTREQTAHSCLYEEVGGGVSRLARQDFQLL